MPSELEKELNRVAWKHIAAEEFAEAEGPVRRLLELTDPADPLRLWHYCGLLAGVLNSLSRADQGTEMYRRALAEALRAGPSRPEVAIARYELANQLLIFGDPKDALATAEPVPPGSGHVQCLLHSVAAHALWKLDRQEDAKRSGRTAIDTAPTDECRSELTEELEYILPRRGDGPQVQPGRRPTRHCNWRKRRSRRSLSRWQPERKYRWTAGDASMLERRGRRPELRPRRRRARDRRPPDHLPGFRLRGRGDDQPGSSRRRPGQRLHRRPAASAVRRWTRGETRGWLAERGRVSVVRSFSPKRAYERTITSAPRPWADRRKPGGNLTHLERHSACIA
jgi:hypothetical protein